MGWGSNDGTDCFKKEQCVHGVIKERENLGGKAVLLLDSTEDVVVQVWYNATNSLWIFTARPVRGDYSSETVKSSYLNKWQSLSCPRKDRQPVVLRVSIAPTSLTWGLCPPL